LKSGLTKIGFAFRSLGFSQKSLAFIKGANAVLDKRSDVGICAFVESIDFPPAQVKFPIFGSPEFRSWDGIMVVSDLNSAERALALQKSDVWFYVYDLEYEQPEYMGNKQKAIETMKKCKCFARHENHMKELEGRGVTCEKTIVLDYDVEAILNTVDSVDKQRKQKSGRA
jgi:hypothetical protein